MRKWFHGDAVAGDLVAAYNLGMCLGKRVGTEHDDQQAAYWIRRAARGVSEAQYGYGRMLASGRGVAADLGEAREWYSRAAEAGIRDAQVALGEMLINGNGGPPDPDRARALFETLQQEDIAARCLRWARSARAGMAANPTRQPPSAGSARQPNLATVRRK